jgi:hypothetical protein
VERGKIYTKFYLQNLKVTDNLADLGVKLRLILKGMLENFMWRCGDECLVTSSGRLY